MSVRVQREAQDLTAAEVVDAVCACLEDLEALEMRVRLRSEPHPTLLERAGLVSAGRPPVTTVIDLKVLMASPGRFRVEAYEEGQHLATVVGDGQTVFEADLRNNQWTKHPYFWANLRKTTPLLLIRDEAVRTPIAFVVGRFSQCWVGPDSPYSHWLRPLLQEAELELEVKRNGTDAGQFILSGAKRMKRGAIAVEMSVALTFDVAAKLPLREEEQVAGTAFLLPAFKATQEFVYQGVRANPKIEEEAFRFEPPPGCRFVSAESLKPAPSPLIGKPMPSSVFYALDGSPVSLSEYRDGKAMLLVFWATWCIPCKLELEALHKSLAAERTLEGAMQVLAVAVDSPLDSIRSYLKRRPLPFRVVYDRQGEAPKSFAFSGVPCTIAIGPDGSVLQVWRGWTGPDQVDEMLRVLRQATR